jgi:hypothetical protein
LVGLGNLNLYRNRFESPKLIYPLARLLLPWRYLPMSEEDRAWIAKAFAAIVISKE